MDDKEFQRRGNERAERLQQEQEDYLKARLAFIDRETELKTKLGIVAVNPQYEFEKSKEWQEHLKEAVKLNADEQKININSTLAQLEAQKDQRAVRDAMNNKQKDDRDY